MSTLNSKQIFKGINNIFLPLWIKKKRSRKDDASHYRGLLKEHGMIALIVASNFEKSD